MSPPFPVSTPPIGPHVELMTTTVSVKWKPARSSASQFGLMLLHTRRAPPPHSPAEHTEPGRSSKVAVARTEIGSSRLPGDRQLPAPSHALLMPQLMHTSFGSITPVQVFRIVHFGKHEALARNT